MKSPTLPSHDVALLIDNARDAEMCRDVDLLRDILSAVWEDIEEVPDYSNFDVRIRAELLRLSGTLLSHYGKSRGLTEYQLRAKDLLTLAIELFNDEGDRSKVAEASIGMAVAYWFAGEVIECDTILSSVEAGFTDDPDYSILLATKLNRIGCLNWHGEFNKAVEIIESIQSWVELCPDLKLLAQFHNHAGIIYRKVHLCDLSIYHLNQAIEISQISKSHRFEGQSMNCLAMTYREVADYASAHKYAEEAISVFESIADTGWIPHVLDSRALIFIDQGHVEEALETINKAVSMFSDSEDYSGLTEAMYTKCRCLLRLRRAVEAFATFSELGHIASVRIGEAARDKYCEMLAEEVRFIEGKTYRERTEFFKRQLIREALRSAGGSIGRAAESLGESHQTLSFILKHKFPELYLELGIKRKPRKTKPPERKIIPPSPPLQHVMMPKNLTFAYDFHVEDKSQIMTFLLGAELTAKLGLIGKKLIAVSRIEHLRPNVPVVYKRGSGYDIGLLIYDDFTNLFIIRMEDEEFVFLADVSIVGVPIGYCDMEDANREKLTFKPIILNSV